jgi:eukaryotic translation initiation factor 2C
MKMKNGEDSAEQTVDVTVYEYFAKHRGIDLTSSAYLPCLDVGKPNRPIFLPLEVSEFYTQMNYALVLILY